MAITSAQLYIFWETEMFAAVQRILLAITGPGILMKMHFPGLWDIFFRTGIKAEQQSKRRQCPMEYR